MADALVPSIRAEEPRGPSEAYGQLHNQQRVEEQRQQRHEGPAQHHPLDSASRASPFCSTNTAQLLDALSNCLLASPAPQQTWEGAPGRSCEELPPQSKAEAADPTQPAPQRSPSMGGACQETLNPSLTMSPLGPNSLGPGSGPAPAGACIAHGVKAVCGKRPKMEDAFSVCTNFFVYDPQADDFSGNKLPARIATQVGEQLEQTSSSPTSSVPLSPNSGSVAAGQRTGPGLSCTDTDPSVGSSSSSTSSDAGCCDTLHFFGVYDGHGGIEAAQHCANRLHYHLSTVLACLGNGHTSSSDPVCMAAGNPEQGSALQCQAEWTLCQHEDLEAAESCPRCAGLQAQGLSGSSPASLASLACSPLSSSTPGLTPSSTPSSCSSGSGADASSAASHSTTTVMLEEALKDAFLRTDAEFAADGSAAMVGSTACVALVGSRKMWIANCGDSRAVLCRAGKAIQVTDDHKPEREDEAERVEKAGGQVLYWNGHRVMGVLAMSRAIGDHGLRPYVIPVPEISVLSRAEEDDFLLLASDGLWDVMANQEAITLAMRCMTKAWEKGASRKAAARIAASVLTKAAIDRGSKDNVTVVIIDLKAPKPTGSDVEAASACGTSTPESTCCDLRASEVGSASPGPGVYTGTSLLSPQLTVLEGALPPCPLPVDAQQVASSVSASDIQKPAAAMAAAAQPAAAVAPAAQVVANIGISAFSMQQGAVAKDGPAGNSKSNMEEVQQQPSQLHHTGEDHAQPQDI